jgi:hypothetical protein
MKRYSRDMTMLDTVMTSITDPMGSMEHLLRERETPPFIVSSCVVLLLVLLVPTLIYQYRYDLQPMQVEVTYALIITLSITFVFFVLFEIILLRVLGVSAPAIKVLATTVYALTPFAPLMVGYYVFNWVAIGSLTITGYFVSGRRVHGDWFLSYFPNFVLLGLFCSFLVFSAGIRVIGKMGLPTGLIMGVFAIPLVLGGYFIGASCAESLYPGTAVMVTKWIVQLTQTPP